MSTQHAPISMPVAKTSDPRLPRLTGIPAFQEYLAQGWGTPDRTPPVPEGAASAAVRHRARLSAELPNDVLVVGAGTAPVRANDTFYDFRPHSDFVWLTGAAIEDAVLVMTPAAGGHDATLFIPPPAYPGETGFFADAAHGELWVGSAPSLDDWSQALQITVRPLRDLDDGLRSGALVAGSVRDDLVIGHDLRPDAAFSQTLANLRMYKDDWEIDQLRYAVDTTVEGFAEVIRQIPVAVEGPGERWLQGTFDRHARTHGNGPGYASIVGSGPHAPTLHWVRCDGAVRDGDALLLDMGVEARSFYTADVTRTFPVSGRFSDAQRRVHDLVERAHRAGLAQVGPGHAFTDFHHAAMEVIAQGLHDWGLLPVSVDEALSPQGQHHRRFLVCGIGHHLGIDVHDCAHSSFEDYQGATMAAGMVLTVEPGLYFHAHDELVPPELRGIGVRIEDDILVTADGSDVLSDALPLDASGLEQWMSRMQN